MPQRKKTIPKKSKPTKSSAKKTSPTVKHKDDKDELWDEELGHVTGGTIVSPRTCAQSR